MLKSTKSPGSWKKIIKIYEQSNLEKSDFCKKHKLAASQFYYWCNKLRPDLKSQMHVSRSKESAFLPIKTTQKEKSFSIILSNGLKVKFDFLPEPSWIANLISSVGELHDQH